VLTFALKFLGAKPDTPHSHPRKNHQETLNMIRKTLFAAVAVTLYAANAFAQDADFDNRYYVAPYVGAVINDSKRNVENAGLLGLSFGRFLTPSFSLEADINRYDADLELATGGSWQVTGIGLAGRIFFGDAEGWRPYGLLGIGTAHSSRDRSKTNNGADFRAGFGVQNAFTDRLSARFEGVYRFMQDDVSLPLENDYSDFMANFGVAIALGEGGAAPMVSPEAENLGEPKAEMTDAPPAEPMAEAPAKANDDDKDGVPNEIDKCPTTPAGEMVSKSTGCPIEEVIDLRGVNFDFDKCTLRPDAVTILNNAVDVLKNHEIVVSVEGHTDARGTDAYNQKLSECRANVVKTYLMNNGVVDGKISGSVGFGESKPIASNETDEGRAQNRRTELVRKN
jgi:OmpA-OmpF porin, OOP family